MEQSQQSGGQQGQQQQQQNARQPVYDTSNGGHYGASAALSAQGYAPVPELYTGTWVGQGLQGNARDILTTYWQHIINHLETDNHDYKIHQLPLARIKKVMKADPEVKMISAEAPILFAKGCDIFITELTMRAWIHAEDNKRRTLQRSDIAAALSKSDMFDFLIDIVPREEATSHTKRSATTTASAGAAAAAAAANAGAAAVSAAASANAAAQGQMPPGQPGVHMGPPDYGSLGQHPMGQEQDYRQPQAMYGGAVQGDPGYGQPQPQMFENMYGAYPHLPPQQVSR
ncbi:hypothetical protein AJ80_00481 [Polytolypa hystricis UAMH7299]|uniref:Core Histone H2A/H2B/H3 domain-containing protein n=1 Tax=Polytolypa hystricis (strain UAMH7299) TaxID=1447883 RepID=A0A2B7Z3J4_POLH7|nr:hypothetical protein AJ80_00481 [Polytolypa hystricis UAMH7299]